MTDGEEKKTGRPRSVMTPEMETQIITAVKLGLREGTAARIAEIAPQTLRSHRDRHPEFAAKLEAAAATGERNALAAVVEKMRKDWKAAAWFLERRFPAEWARREVVIDDTSDKGRQMRDFFKAAIRESQGTPPEGTDDDRGDDANE